MAKVGDRLPSDNVYLVEKDNIRQLPFSELYAGRDIALFAMPSTFTPVCTRVHLPSIVAATSGFLSRGIDRVCCLVVSDPFSIRAWANAEGAFAAGLDMIADPKSTVTRAMGMEFDAPAVGLFGRSKRYALLAENGIIKVMNTEDDFAVCDRTKGDVLLTAVDSFLQKPRRFRL